MKAPVKLGAFVAGLAVVFATAWGIGNASGSPRTAPTPPAPTPAADGHDHGAHGGQPVAGPPGGLQVSQDGFTLNPERTIFTAGKATDFRFTVTAFHGQPVTGYEVLHGKRLHLIVVSRDLATFLHLHPELDADGVWSVRLTLPEAGAYRAFADFAPFGVPQMTLGVDLLASGDFTPEKLPPPSRVAQVDEYAVIMRGDLVPGRSGPLTLLVTRAGVPVTDLEPYLGAYGHLVALRAGDLAYLHVHPDGTPGDGTTTSGPSITFHAGVPSAGVYRLFLDFKHGGKVRTAAFTVQTGRARHSH